MHLQLRQSRAVVTSLLGSFYLYLLCRHTKIKTMRSLGGRTTSEEIKVLCETNLCYAFLLRLDVCTLFTKILILLFFNFRWTTSR